MRALTTAQESQLARLEAIVEVGLQTFIDVGVALSQIKDLCQFTANEFDSYCMTRFKFSRRRGNQLIVAAAVAIPFEDSGTRVPHEKAARELARIPPELRKPAMEVVASQGPVTASGLRDLAKRIHTEKTPERMAQVVEESKRNSLALAEHKRRNPSEALDRYRELVSKARKVLGMLEDVPEEFDALLELAGLADPEPDAELLAVVARAAKLSESLRSVRRG